MAAIGAKTAAPTVPASPLTTARRDAHVVLFMLFPPFRRMTAISRLDGNVGCCNGHASNGRAAVASAQVTPGRCGAAYRRHAPRGRHQRDLAARHGALAALGAHTHSADMFVVTEADAAAIRAAFDRGGELSAAVELRRLFPAITDTAQARASAPGDAGGTPRKPVKAAHHVNNRQFNC